MTQGRVVVGQGSGDDTQSMMEQIDQAISKATGGANAQSLSDFLMTNGVDVSDPVVQDLLDNGAMQAGYREYLKDPTSSFAMDFVQKTLVSLRAAYPLEANATDYTQAFMSTKASEISWEPTGPPTGVPPAFRGPGPSTEGADYKITSTGAIVFRNGVIVQNPGDPTSVVFDPSMSTPGSALWLRDAQQGWTEEKIVQWKKKLVEAGYLPKGSAKDASWSAPFMSALQSYQANMYANYGRPVIQDTQSATGAAGGIDNLRMVRATISEDVRNQYITMFGQTPSPGELQQWTDFIIHSGNRLQHQGLTAGSAAQEAMARGLQAWRNSGVGQFRQKVEENTQLADSLRAAAAAAGSAIGR